MRPVLPQVHAQLVNLADREANASRLRSRLGLGQAVAATTFVGLALGGTAFAARGEWLPVLGFDRADRGTAISGQKPSSEQLDLVAALRRPATDEDRAAAETLYPSLNGDSRGVFVDYVRKLGTTQGGSSVVVFPAREWRLSDERTTNGVLCLSLSGGELPMSGLVCAPPAKVREGALQLTYRPAGRSRGRAIRVQIVADDPSSPSAANVKVSAP